MTEKTGINMNRILGEALPFWNLLTVEQKRRMELHCVEQSYQKGEIIYNSLKNAPGLKIVKTGRIRLSMPVQNGEILLYRLEQSKFSILGVFPELRNLPWDIHVEAETDTELLTISDSVYLSISEENLDLWAFNQKIVVERMADMIGIFSSVVLATTQQRLAWLLLHMYKENGNREICLTHEVMAKDVGTAREIVTRILKQFGKMGLVRVERGKIYLINIDGLKAIQGGQD